MTPDRFRRLALALPDAEEGEHHAHADFRVQGRIFASLQPDGLRAMVKVPVALQQRLVAAHPGVFAPATGAWGRAGCTMVQLEPAPLDVVREALAEAWQWGTAAGAGTPRRPRRAKRGSG